MKKRIMGLFLAFVMVLSITACGTKEPVTVASVLEESAKATAEMKNMNLGMKMAATISAMGVSMNMDFGMDFSILTDPYKAKMSGNINIPTLLNSKLDSYLINKDEKWYNYTNIDGEWTKEEVDKSYMEELLEMTMSATYLEPTESIMDKFTLSEVKEDGKKLYKLEGVITGEDMISDLEKMDLSDDVEELFGSQLYAGMTMNDLYKKIGDISVVYYINQENNYPHKMTMDMKDAFQSIISEIQGAFSEVEELGELSIDKLDVEVTFDIDTATDFELPEEAKNLDE